LPGISTAITMRHAPAALSLHRPDPHDVESLCGRGERRSLFQPGNRRQIRVSPRDLKALALIVLGALLMLAGGALTLPGFGAWSIRLQAHSILTDLRGYPGGVFAYLAFIAAVAPGVVLIAIGVAARGR
jgi:hypothetical protein